MDTVLEAEPTEETFEQLLAKFAYSPSTDEGTGFLPILARSSGHLLYLVGRYNEKTKPTAAKAKEEIDEVLAHWANIVIDKSLSAKAKTDVDLVEQLIRRTQRDIESWTTDEANLRLQSIVNRMAQLLANLDREVLGLRGSDAGLRL